jgi:hypothetical protein
MSRYGSRSWRDSNPATSRLTTERSSKQSFRTSHPGSGGRAGLAEGGAWSGRRDSNSHNVLFPKQAACHLAYVRSFTASRQRSGGGLCGSEVSADPLSGPGADGWCHEGRTAEGRVCRPGQVTPRGAGCTSELALGRCFLYDTSKPDLRWGRVPVVCVSRQTGVSFSPAGTLPQQLLDYCVHVRRTLRLVTLRLATPFWVCSTDAGATWEPALFGRTRVRCGVPSLGCFCAVSVTSFKVVSGCFPGGMRWGVAMLATAQGEWAAVLGGPREGVALEAWLPTQKSRFPWWEAALGETPCDVTVSMSRAPPRGESPGGRP